ncbi:MAG: hypothetical protein U1A78_16480 [Polyangia bacterium]
MRAGPVVWGIAALLLAPSLSTSAGAQPVPPELAASVALEHRLRDLLTVVSSRYEVDVVLRSEPAGTARLELRGHLESVTATLEPPRGPAPPGPRSVPPRRVPVDERWSGQVRRDGDALLVTLERTDAFRPALAVSVPWRCRRETVSLDGQATAVWACRTAQAMTTAAGPGHPLPPYLQVPLYLLPSEQRLRVEASARGGADHRSSIESVRFSRRR